MVANVIDNMIAKSKTIMVSGVKDDDYGDVEDRDRDWRIQIC